jgi:hypothetical protein
MALQKKKKEKEKCTCLIKTEKEKCTYKRNEKKTVPAAFVLLASLNSSI